MKRLAAALLRLEPFLSLIACAALMVAASLPPDATLRTPALITGGVLALIPWALRFLRDRRFGELSPLGLPLLLFYVSIFTALSVSYRGEASVARVWLWLAAWVLFHGVYQLRGGTRALKIGWAALLMGAVVAYVFISQNDWATFDKVPFLSKIGAAISGVLPHLPSGGFDLAIHPNVAGGALMALWPIGWLGVWESWRRGRRLWAAAGAILSLASLCGLLLTVSRASWMGLAMGCGTVIAWVLARRFLKPSRRAVWLMGVGWACGLLLMVAFLLLSAPVSGLSRVTLYGQAASLARAYPFTGGGLDAFPGLYAGYVLRIPHWHTSHAHNMYINVWVEQGILGMASFIGVVGGGLLIGLRALIRTKAGHNPSPALIAGLAALIAVSADGILDATLVASRTIPLLWLPLGLLLGEVPAISRRARAWWGVGVIMGACALWLLTGNLTPAAFEANLGAVAEARVSLGGFPLSGWQMQASLDDYREAVGHLQNALAADPQNVTALYRLGNIYSEAWDFEKAADHLESAARIDPDHVGIRKALGLAYLWTGRIDAARATLDGLPDIRREVELRAGWWRGMRQPDLAAHAEAFLK